MAIVVAGCATTPPEPELDRAAVRERLAEAERHLADDRVLAAVRVYETLIEDAPAEDAQRWRLQLVELLFDRGYPELALERYQRLDAGAIPEDLAVRKQVVDARAALARQQHQRALRLLPAPDPRLDAAVRARILATRARALAAGDEPQAALAAWIERAEILAQGDDRAAVERNHEAIWNLLDGLSSERLRTIADSAGTRTQRGWARLALAQKRARAGEQGVEEAFSDWASRHPGHPAAERFMATLRERVIEQLTYPPRIDVLLPLTGPLADAGRAVRDGMIALYYDTPDYMQRPELVFRDVGAAGAAATAAYAAAVDAGSDFVVGPLQRSAVTEVSRAEAPSVPVLALNYLADPEASVPASFHQFGLAPEDEARQVAEAAVRNDRLHALALTPGNAWGDRLLAAFSERLERLGGVVLEETRYDPESTDYARPIQLLLDLDASRARYRRLREVIGTDVRFEPRRRDDAEVIFLAAQPQQARLAVPQLEFHRIGNIPVYATSHVFSGEVNPDDDWDMNGLFFTEIPWILDRAADTPTRFQRMVEARWPAGTERDQRLFALGADALEIVPLLERLRAGSGTAHAGRTGSLTVDFRGRVERELGWARFDKGRPQPIEQPRIETEEMLGADVRERADDDGDDGDPD